MKGPYRILVVDDEPDLQPLILQRMRRKVRSGMYSFQFAYNGIEALEVLDQDRDIDMVVTDINMPRMDGLTLLGQIPSVAGTDILCIVISAYGDMKNIRTAINRGAFDFVTKPLDFEDLQVTMDRALRHLEEWRAALSSRDALVALQNELDVASSTQQSILPKRFRRAPTFRSSPAWSLHAMSGATSTMLSVWKTAGLDWPSRTSLTRACQPPSS